MTKEKYQKIKNLIEFKSFNDFLGRYGLYFLFFMLASIIIFIFKDFIFLKKIYLFKDFGSDSINITYPSYYALANGLEKEGIPTWLFSQGMGQNIFPAGLSDPFSLFIILTGKKFVYYTLFYAELLKILFAGLFFYLFLKKISLTDYTSLVGAILYSFSGFVILGGQWSVFSTQAVYIALLLYSFEKFYQDDNWTLLPISIFLIAAYQPVDVYYMGLFLLGYVILRLLIKGETEKIKIIGVLTKFSLLAVAGVAMSALFFLNGLQVMLESPRVEGNASYFGSLIAQPFWGLEGFMYGNTHYLTALMRFFSCDILGSGSKFRGWYNYIEAPLFYCGLISLVSFPHVLNLPDKRRKIILSFVIMIFAVAIIFPFFRYAYWLFTGNYYRVFSFFVAIALLLMALKSIDDIDARNDVNIKITIGTILTLLCILYYPYANAHIINKEIRTIVTVLLIVYSLFVYLLQFRSIKNLVKIALLMLIVVELVLLYQPAVNRRPVILGREIPQKVGYNDYTIDALAFIKSNDKTFYRVNKDYYSGRAVHEGLNDANAQDFYGTASYHCFNQLHYINFLEEIDIIEKGNEYGTRWSRGVTKYPLLHSFAGVKYALTRQSNPNLVHFGYDFVPGNFGDIKVLKNKYALPLGFAYEKYIPLNDFKMLPQNEKMIALYKAAVIDDSIYNNIGNLMKIDLNAMHEDYWQNDFPNDIKTLGQDTLNISEMLQHKIKGTINVNKNKILFLSIPFDRGWSVEVDGKKMTPMMVNIGFIGVPLDKGLHKVELTFTPVYFLIGAVISLMAILLFIGLVIFKYRRDATKAIHH